MKWAAVALLLAAATMLHAAPPPPPVLHSEWMADRRDGEEGYIMTAAAPCRN